jgi:hypothetical protein
MEKVCREMRSALPVRQAIQNNVRGDPSGNLSTDSSVKLSSCNNNTLPLLVTAARIAA